MTLYDIEQRVKALEKQNRGLPIRASSGGGGGNIGYYEAATVALLPHPPGNIHWAGYTDDYGIYDYVPGTGWVCRNRVEDAG